MIIHYVLCILNTDLMILSDDSQKRLVDNMSLLLWVLLRVIMWENVTDHFVVVPNFPFLNLRHKYRPIHFQPGTFLNSFDWNYYSYNAGGICFAGHRGKWLMIERKNAFTKGMFIYTELIWEECHYQSIESNIWHLWKNMLLSGRNNLEIP